MPASAAVPCMRQILFTLYDYILISPAYRQNGADDDARLMNFRLPRADFRQQVTQARPKIRAAAWHYYIAGDDGTQGIARFTARVSHNIEVSPRCWAIRRLRLLYAALIRTRTRRHFRLRLRRRTVDKAPILVINDGLLIFR